MYIGASKGPMHSKLNRAVQLCKKVHEI